MTKCTRKQFASRRGFTFLEAVLASALLSIIAAGIFAAFGAAWRAEIRGAQTLAAAEIANRLVISYLDDSTSLDNNKMPDVIDYNGMRFRWRHETGRVSIRDVYPDARVGRNNQVTIIEQLDKMRKITVVAWVDEGSSDFTSPGDAASFELVRIADPLGYRSDDSIERFLQNPEAQIRLLEDLSGIGE